jgi:hypothetical protein
VISSSHWPLPTQQAQVTIIFPEIPAIKRVQTNATGMDHQLLTKQKQHNNNKINVLQELNVYSNGKYAALLSVSH